MKETGIVRQVDSLGRVVIPVELRRVLDLNKDDKIEFYVNDDSIVLKKYAQCCVLCGATSGVRPIKDKNICFRCVTEIRTLK